MRRTYMRLARAADYLQLFDLISHPDQAGKFEAQANTIADLDAGQRSTEQKNSLERYNRIRSALHDLVHSQTLNGEEKLQAETLRKNMDLYLPIDADPGVEFDKHWIGMGQSVLDLRQYGKVAPAAAAFFGLLKDYQDDQPTAFNSHLASYRQTVEQVSPGKSAKAAFEVFFNRFDPFMVCMILYVVVFLLVCVYACQQRSSFAQAAWPSFS